MYKNKTYVLITLGILVIFFLGLGGTSIGHIIRYWSISNDWYYAEILAIENAIGIISSILLTFHKDKKLRRIGYLIFLATFFVELAGNVYYYYITIEPNSTAFTDLVALTRPIFDSNEITVNYAPNMRSWVSFIQGFWLPITHVCVFTGIATLIERSYLSNKKTNPSSKKINSNKKHDIEVEYAIEATNMHFDNNDIENFYETDIPLLSPSPIDKNASIKTAGDNKKDAFLGKLWKVKK